MAESSASMTSSDADSNSSAGSNTSGYVDDWQSGKDFAQTNIMMLDSETLADATFRVGEEGEIIRAHRFLLASRSCVFFAMFCGPMSENGEVEVKDIQGQDFREFLRFLYSNDAALTPDNVLNLLYCSKKYCVKSLEQRCLQFCKSSITPDNACTLLEQACVYDEKELQQKALGVMTREAKQVLVSESFTRLKHNNLDRFIGRDDIRAEELYVFNGALAWAKAECKRQEKVETGPEFRTVLGDSLFKIRFPLLKQSDFVDLVGSLGILTDSERVKILERYISPKSPVDPFISKPRRTVPAVCRIQRLVHGGVGQPSTRSSDALYITCDKNITFQGVMLYSPADFEPVSWPKILWGILETQDTAAYTSTVYMTVVVRDSDNKRIGIHHVDLTVTPVDEQTEIIMANPVLLRAGKTYLVSVLIEGRVRCSGRMNGLKELHDPGSEATWQFAHAPKSSFDNSLKQGHISGIVYTLAGDG